MSERLAGTSIIYPIGDEIEFIDFAATLVQHASSSTILQDVQIFSERNGKASRVSWSSTFVEKDDARIEMDMLAGAAGAVIETRADLRDLEI